VNRPLRRLALAGAVVLIGAAILVAAGSAGQAKNQIARGGTLNVGWEQSFGFTDNFDPTGEYLGDAFGIMDNLLVRTLVGYNHTPGADGNKIVPDIASSWKISNGGKTYTFHLKSGIKFGPPVNRAVTSKDFVTAFERLAKPADGAEYAFYYSVIKGFDEYGKGKAKTIAGISTPNDSTIVFNLKAPAGDFLYRVSMPATGPQPAEVTKCFEGKAGQYGRDLVSTAGYMIAGMDKVDISSCSALKPASGFDGQTVMDLVRNPNYDQSTDPTRKNYPDEVKFTVDASADDIYNKIEAGQLDLATSSIPPQVLRKYATNSSLKSHFFQNSGDRTWYITMNLTQPPFDDVHVRRAMNWIMDKAALVQGWGGPTIGAVANHIVPDTLFNFKLQGFKPYKTPGDHGSVAKAKAAMKGSKYDTANNGMCSDPKCHGVLLLADTRAVDTKMLPVIEADAKKIGITFTVRTINGAYPTIQTPSKNIPIAERPGWGKDFADPVTFFSPLFDGRTIIPKGNTNYSLVGITPAQCKKLGVTGDCSPYDAKTGLGVPSVDAQLDKCEALVNTEASDARTVCYEGLDRYLSTQVVPWVPYLWSYVTRITSNNVTHYQFDQFSTTPAYSQIAVK